MNILTIADDSHYESIIKSQLDSNCQFEILISANIQQILDQLNQRHDFLNLVIISQSSTDLTAQLLKELQPLKCIQVSTIVVLSTHFSTDVLTTLTKAGAHAIFNLPDDNNKFQQLFPKLTTVQDTDNFEQSSLPELLKNVANKSEALAFGIRELEQSKIPLRPAKQITKEAILKSIGSSGNREALNIESFTRGLIDNEKKH